MGSLVCVKLFRQALKYAVESLAGLPNEDVKDMPQIHLTRCPSKGQIIFHRVPDLAGSPMSGHGLDVYAHLGCSTLA